MTRDGRPDRAVALMSGGIDSIVSLAAAVAVCDVRLALFFDYGQPAVERERQAVLGAVNYYSIPFREISLPWLGELMPTELREAHLNGSTSGTPLNRLESVWIPNRNGILTNCAAAFAEAYRYHYVVTGFNSEEAEEFPDNRREFVARLNRGLILSTRNGVRVVSFTQNLLKAEIIHLGMKLSAPLSIAWSCYEGGARMCGTCSSCLKLKNAIATVPPERRPRLEFVIE